MKKENQDKSKAIAPLMFFQSIPIEIPHRMVLTRLGYRRNKTIFSAKQREKLDDCIMTAFSYCKPAGCWRRIDIAEKTGDSIILQNGSVLESKSLTGLLRNSYAVAFMASTVGSDIVRKISDIVNQGDGATGIIYDAVGSQSADATMNWMNEFIRHQLSRCAERLTKHRFSPGFGDFSLENQKIIFPLLELDRLDLQLTSRYMIVPEKSVTAVAGIEKL